MRTPRSFLLVVLLLTTLGCSRAPYVSHDDYERNRALQLQRAPQRLSKLGFKPGVQGRLGCIFTTDTKGKGDELVLTLRHQGHASVTLDYSESSDTYLVKAFAPPARITETTLESWVMEMCELGYEHDALFDNWGVDTK